MSLNLQNYLKIIMIQEVERGSPDRPSLLIVADVRCKESRPPGLCLNPFFAESGDEQ